MKRQILSIVLALSMGAVLMAGCGKTASSSAEKPASAAEAVTEEAETEDAAVEEAEEVDAADAGASAESDAIAEGAEEHDSIAESVAEEAEEAAQSDATQAAAEEDEQASVDITSGTPWVCSILEGAVTADTETDVKDDFYMAANKDKLVEKQIPEGYSRAGTMYDVAMQSDDDIKKLFTSDVAAESHDAQLALNLYSLLMDWDSRNAVGIAPLKEMVDKIEQIDSIDALMAYYSETPVEDLLFRPFVIGFMEGFDDSSTYVLNVDANDLVMEDSGEYSEITDYGTARKEAAHTLAVKMLCKMGYSEEEAEQTFENCLAFENAIAPSIYTLQEQQESDIFAKMNNHYDREALQEAQGKLPILACAEGQMGFPQVEDMLIFNPEWLKALNGLLTEENLEQLKDYSIVHGVIDRAADLDRECYEWSNDFNNAVVGSTGILPDDLASSQTVTDILSWPVARLYSETYLKQEDKDRISLLVDEVLDEYHGIINEADFLSDGTKALAIEKLDTIDKKILWPDDWSLYVCDNLEIASAADGGTLWEALKAIEVSSSQKNVEQYSEPVNKERWYFPPTIFNCAYNPSANDISILGSFARGTIYYPGMSDEELLATVGMITGHEVSHAFDINGSQFDKDGNMVSWWTDEDRAAFEEKDKKMQDYLDAIQPWAGTHLKGSIMTGETCADMGGMKCALRIASKKEGFDYDKFFRTYADLWMSKWTYKKAVTNLNDPHPLDYLRVNCVLQQFDEFQKEYDIKEGDGMYLAPEDRVNIW